MHGNYTQSKIPLMTNDLKAERFPQAVVKQNAKPDRQELARRSNLSDGEKVMFPMSALEGELGDAKILAQANDLAFCLRDDPFGDLGSIQDRNMLNQNNAIAVVTNFNGMAGTPEEIMEKIEPVGWIDEQANGDTRSAQLNVRRGGSFTLLWNNPDGIRQNAYFEAVVPTEAQADEMKADKECQARGARGVVPCMYREYNPHSQSYLSAESLYRHLALDGNTDKIDKNRKKAADQLVSTIAGLARLIANNSDGGSEEDVLRALIKGAVEDPLNSRGHEVVSLLNTLVQEVAQTRLNKDRFVVGKTHQAAKNGNYFPFHAVHYSF
jgi:hypothetical protein